MAFPIAPVIAGLFSAGSTIYQNAVNKRSQLRAQDFSHDEAALARQFSHDEAALARNASSIPAIISQMRQAGLNSSLAYSGLSGLSPVSASATPASSPGFYNATGFSGLSNDINQARITDSVVSANQSEARLKNAQASDLEFSNSPEMQQYRRTIMHVRASEANMDYTIKEAESVKSLFDSTIMQSLYGVVAKYQESDASDGSEIVGNVGFLTPDAFDRIKNSNVFKVCLKEYEQRLSELNVKIKYPAADVLKIVYDCLSQYGNFDVNNPSISDDSLAALALRLQEADTQQHEFDNDMKEFKFYSDIAIQSLGIVGDFVSQIMSFKRLGKMFQKPSVSTTTERYDKHGNFSGGSVTSTHYNN